MSKDYTILACGDVSLAKTNPEEKFELVQPLLQSVDFRIGQMEEILSDNCNVQVYAYPKPRGAKGGDPAHAGVLGKECANFDLLTFATNHILDYSEQAMQDTIDNMAKVGVPMIGAGWDDEAAKKPYIFDANGTKVGILDYCSVLPKGYAAAPGHGGANPLRVATYYRQFDWQPGTPPEIIDIPDQEDLDAMEAQIKELRKQVDVLLVVVHWGVHFMPYFIADYQFQLGHKMIDFGADAVIGHHAHLVKGHEIYKGKPIFYSIGNFAIGDVPFKVIAGDKQNGFFTFKPYRWKQDKEHPMYAFPMDSRNAVALKLYIGDKKLKKTSLVPLYINGDNRPQMLKEGEPLFDQVSNYVRTACEHEWLNGDFVVENDELVVVEKETE